MSFFLERIAIIRAPNDVDPARGAKFFEPGKAGRALRLDKQAFLAANFAHGSNDLVIIDRDCAAFGRAQDFQDQKIADRSWHPEAGCDRMRVWKFSRKFFA